MVNQAPGLWRGEETSSKPDWGGKSGQKLGERRLLWSRMEERDTWGW